MKKSGTHVFPARFSSLAVIGEFIARAAASAGLDERTTYDVQMAVDEACSNIIEHAYTDEETGEITCSYQITSDKLVVVLRDQGRHFDPTYVSEPDISTDLEGRTRGGLGIYFIRKLMDQVKYEFRPESGNVLTLVKYREAAP